MTPTPTPPAATPTTLYFWPTPTPRPTSESPVVLTMPPTNPILVAAAEETVQAYNMSNRQGLMDSVITLVLLVMIIGAWVRFYWKLRKVGSNNDD